MFADDSQRNDCIFEKAEQSAALQEAENLFFTQKQLPAVFRLKGKAAEGVETTY